MKRSISGSGGSLTSLADPVASAKKKASAPASIFRYSCTLLLLMFLVFLYSQQPTASPSDSKVVGMSKTRGHLLKMPVSTMSRDCSSLQSTHTMHDNSYYDHEVDIAYGEFEYSQLCVALDRSNQEYLLEISTRPASSSTTSDCSLYVTDDYTLPTLKSFKYRSQKSRSLKIPLYARDIGGHKFDGYHSLAVGLYAKGGGKVSFINQCLWTIRVSRISHEDMLLTTNLRRGDMDHGHKNFVRKKSELKELSASVHETLKVNTKLAQDAIKGLKSSKYRPVHEDFFDAIAQETIREHMYDKEKGERIDGDGNSVWGKFHGEKEGTFYTDV